MPVFSVFVWPELFITNSDKSPWKTAILKWLNHRWEDLMKAISSSKSSDFVFQQFLNSFSFIVEGRAETESFENQGYLLLVSSLKAVEINLHEVNSIKRYCQSHGWFLNIKSKKVKQSEKEMYPIKMKTSYWKPCAAWWMCTNLFKADFAMAISSKLLSL